jgi:lysozyme
VALLVAHGISDEFALLGRRGYYRDTMGEPGKNDRGIYDDAMILVTPTAYITYNANADPSIRRPRVAVLVAGVWSYRIGIHNISKSKDRQYKALVQAAEVTVRRDQSITESGWFGINIHRGGWNTTSSLGCQTIYPPQWDSFIATVELEMKRHARKRIPYVLTERDDAVG